jgi:hypothetical protein
MRVKKRATTKDALDHSLKLLKARIKSPLDTVFIYVSAHGTVARNPKTKQMERYIVTSNTNRDVAKTAINVKQLIQKLRTFASKRIVLMLATCYTGSPQSKSQTKPGQKGNFRKQVKPLQAPALQVLSAAGFAQAAYESTKLRSDVYTHFFLDCLHKLAKQKKRVSTIEAHICATQPTTQFVKRALNAIQVPGVDSRPGANRDVILTSKQNKQSDIGYFWTGKKKKHVRYEVQKQTLRKDAPQQRVLNIVNPEEYIGLRVGRYTITMRNRYGRILKRYTITIRRQQTTYLDQERHLDPLYRLERGDRMMHQPGNPLVTTGYVVGLLIVAGGGGALIHGIWTNTTFSVFSGGMIIGAGALVMLASLVADVALRNNERRINELRRRTWWRRSSHNNNAPPPDYMALPLGTFK